MKIYIKGKERTEHRFSTGCEMSLRELTNLKKKKNHIPANEIAKRDSIILFLKK